MIRTYTLNQIKGIVARCTTYDELQKLSKLIRVVYTTRNEKTLILKYEAANYVLMRLQLYEDKSKGL